MSDEGLRAALEARLSALPTMVHLGNDYPTQALPKADLLDLMAMHPPSKICGDIYRSFGVDLLCRKPTGHDGEHQDVRGATWAYLTDDGAAAPAATLSSAAEATSTVAPSSPHRPTCGTTYGESCDGYCPTPAIDRRQIIRTLYDQGAYCGSCDYESHDWAVFDWTDCADCKRVLGKYADAVLALIEGAQ